MTVKTMTDIKGYGSFSAKNKILAVLTIQKHLSSIEDLDTRNLDILSIKKGKKCFVLTMIEDNKPFITTLEIETIKQFKSRVRK